MNYKHVIGHYYGERTENLKRIVRELNDNGVKPLIWNNSGYEFPAVMHADIVDCPNNPIHGRYLAALIYPECDVFVFQDDDLMLGKETIDKLIEAAMVEPTYFHGVEGNSLDWGSTKPYSKGRRVRLPETNPDMVIRAYACHRNALEFGLNWILRHGIHPGRSETYLFTGGRSHLVPGTSWDDLPEGGVGLCTAKNHDSEIDEFIRRWGLQPA